MHVLSTPPAFILSQDQTLRCIFKSYKQLHSSKQRPKTLPSQPKLACACRNLNRPHPLTLHWRTKSQLEPPSSDRRVLKSALDSSWYQQPSLAISSTFPQVTFQDLRSGRNSTHRSLSSGPPREKVSQTTSTDLYCLFLLTGPHTSAAYRPQTQDRVIHVK